MNVVDEMLRCKPWVMDALKYSGGTHIWEDVLVAVIQGRMQLWPMENSCIITEIVTYPRKKVLNVFLGGGNMEELASLHPDVIEWSKAQGCTCAVISGRQGWERAFAKYGWEKVHVTLKKEY